MRNLALVAALLVSVFFTGCFPMHQTISPPVTGVVLDAKSQRPIEGAEAVIAYSGYPPPTTPEALTNTPLPIVSTKTDGSFAIPEGWERVWVTFLPIDPSFPATTLVVRANGYDPAVVPITTIGARATNVGEIFLVPK